MERTRIFSLLLCAFAAAVTACSGDTTSETGFTDDAATPGNPNGGRHGDSGTSGSTGGGVACGPMTTCSASQECCFGMGGGGLGGAAGSCVDQGTCTGSSLGCSGSAQCGGGGVCCFAYSAGDGGGAGPIGFAPMTFAATCQSQCSTGDMVHYQLCGDSSECSNGDTCVRGPYAMYCATVPSFDGGLGFMFDAGGFNIPLPGADAASE